MYGSYEKNESEYLTIKVRLFWKSQEASRQSVRFVAPAAPGCLSNPSARSRPQRRAENLTRTGSLFRLRRLRSSRSRTLLSIPCATFISVGAQPLFETMRLRSNRVRPEPWGCGGLRYIARPPLAPTKHGGGDCRGSCGFAKTADCYASGFAARGRTFASICGRLYATGRSQRRVKIAKPIFGPPLGDASARRVAGAIRCCLACKPPCVPSGKTLRYKRNDDSSYLPCPT